MASTGYDRQRKGDERTSAAAARFCFGCIGMEERRNAESCATMAQQREDILLKGVNDLNELQIFRNSEFGDIRTVKEDITHE